jgi:hypothetical protein
MVIGGLDELARNESSTTPGVGEPKSLDDGVET